MPRKLKTEHGGAKNGGGYWGTRQEAKELSRKKRRVDDQVIVHDQQKDLQSGTGAKIASLLRTAKSRLQRLRSLLAKVSDHWGYEDPIYRFYHHSFKVYDLQTGTQQIVAELQMLAPPLKLNADFLRIIGDGTGKSFQLTHNENWSYHSRPIVEAFFHARHVLEMVCKYAGEFNEPPQQMMPSGWATVLYLYNLR